MAAEDAQTAAEGRHCRRETERLELAARLASLAATAEHRTRGEKKRQTGCAVLVFRPHGTFLRMGTLVPRCTSSEQRGENLRVRPPPAAAAREASSNPTY